jgi:hypothetical protein
VTGQSVNMTSSVTWTEDTMERNASKSTLLVWDNLPLFITSVSSDLPRADEFDSFRSTAFVVNRVLCSAPFFA